MSVLQGQVKLTVDVRGTGDAPKKVDDTTRAVRALDGAAKKSAGSVKELDGAVARTGSTVGHLREGIIGMAGAADDGVLKVKEGFGKIVEAGGLVIGVVAGLVAAFEGLSTVHLQPAIDAIKEAGNQAERVSKAFAQAAANVRTWKNEVIEAKLAEIGTEIELAKAANNPKKAAELAALGARIAGDRTTQGYRDTADQARRDADQAQKRREEAVRTLAENQVRVLNLMALGAKPGGSFRFNPRTGEAIEVDSPQARERYQVELAGLLAMQPGLMVAAGMGEDKKAALELATALDSLASASERLTEQKVREAQAGEDAKKPRGGGAPRGELMPQNDNDTSGSAILDVGVRAGLSPANDDDLLGSAILGFGDLSTPMADAATSTRELAEVWLELAGAVGTAAGAISQVLPELGGLATAMTEITGIWSSYGEANFDVAKATTQSMALMAKAGAEHIKNERLRAGVLAVIETGLGIATAFLNPAESAGHFAAAAVLGSVALFGGARSASSSSPQRNVVRATTSTPVAAAPTVNIFGGWFGNGTPQESAQALWDRMLAAHGTGFVPAQRAA